MKTQYTTAFSVERKKGLPLKEGRGQGLAHLKKRKERGPGSPFKDLRYAVQFSTQSAQGTPPHPPTNYRSTPDLTLPSYLITKSSPSAQPGTQSITL